MGIKHSYTKVLKNWSNTFVGDCREEYAHFVAYGFWYFWFFGDCFEEYGDSSCWIDCVRSCRMYVCPLHYAQRPGLYYTDILDIRRLKVSITEGRGAINACVFIYIYVYNYTLRMGSNGTQFLHLEMDFASAMDNQARRPMRKRFHSAWANCSLQPNLDNQVN